MQTQLATDADTENFLTDPDAPADDAPPSDGGTVTRELECRLTEAEILERGHRMAAAERRADHYKTQRRKLNASLREQTDLMSDLAKAIDTGIETREVTCRWMPDYKRKVWDLMRQDCEAAALEQRAMSPLDLQARLPLDADDDAGDGSNGHAHNPLPDAPTPKPRKRTTKKAKR